MFPQILDSLKGKRVVLTGGSRGIGEQMAYHYAKLGADIMITARRESRLQEVRIGIVLESPNKLRLLVWGDCLVQTP